MKCLIASSSFGQLAPEPFDRLREAGFQVVANDLGRPLDNDELAARIGEATAVVAGIEPYTRAVLEAAPRLLVLARHGAGTDSVDLDKATQLGIAVTNTPGANTEAVADLAFGLMLACARQIPAADRSTKAGEWRRFVGLGVAGKTLGIVGLGRIGSAVAQRARAFNMTILASDPQFDEAFAREHGIRRADLDALLRVSDFVTLHLPLTDETRGLIGARELSLMKPTAVLVNTARGAIVDESALADALCDGRLFAAGLDVYVQEPPSRSALLELDNAITLPHLASHTRDAAAAMGHAVVDSILDVMADRQPQHLANPEVWPRRRRGGAG